MNTEAIRVLVVEDEVYILENTTFFLEENGFEVFTAISGEDALSFLEGETVDVGLFDMRLPGMDGDALIQAAYQIDPTIGFLIFTGSTNYQLPSELRKIGISEEQVFFKPMTDMQPLAKAIVKLAAQRSDASQE